MGELSKRWTNDEKPGTDNPEEVIATFSQATNPAPINLPRPMSAYKTLRLVCKATGYCSSLSSFGKCYIVPNASDQSSSGTWPVGSVSATQGNNTVNASGPTIWLSQMDGSKAFACYGNVSDYSGFDAYDMPQDMETTKIFVHMGVLNSVTSFSGTLYGRLK